MTERNENHELCLSFAEDIERVYREGIDEDGNEYTLSDWLNDSVLDIEYMTDSSLNYKSCRLLIACGGPNIYVNTNNYKIELFWWSQSESCFLRDDVASAIDDLMEEIYNSMR